uniref:DUF559 domain-containing protein n=1 Tax=viral metagenome TaxID=1070528 RepID=A0A6C0ITC2_9ZZZZ
MSDKDFEYKQASIIQNKYNCNIIINEEQPYTLYKVSDIANIIQTKHLRTILQTFDDSLKQKISIQTNGGLQKVSYVTYNGLLKILCKSKKEETQIICKELNINIYNYHFISIENDTINNIMKAFKSEIMYKQHKILNYYVDLFIEKYNIIIECDENHHNSLINKKNDLFREENIKNEIINCVFIRYNPYKKDFNIFDIINKIYIQIKWHDISTTSTS